MESTQKAINDLMEKMELWGMFDVLTESEKQSIKIDLKNIAGNAIMDANDIIKNTLPNLYKQITKY